MKLDYEAVVFDFDGTLVDSNELKYRAYFKLFPNEELYRAAIQHVLDMYQEKSRYFIIQKVLMRLSTTKVPDIDKEVERLSIQYNDIVFLGAKICAELQNAQVILGELYAKYPLFVSSNTPEVYLREILEYRKWNFYFKGIFGYPRDKSDTLKIITQQWNLNPARV